VQNNTGKSPEICTSTVQGTTKVQNLSKQTDNKAKETGNSRHKKSSYLQGFTLISYGFGVWLLCAGYFPIQNFENT